MSNPAENVPTNRPARWCDRGFLFRALGLGVARAVTIGAMVKLADQLHRASQGMKATIAMVADVHHPPADRTITIEDVEFPKSEIGIRCPRVGHLADLHVLVRSIDCEGTTRGYAKNSAFLAQWRVVENYQRPKTRLEMRGIVFVLSCPAFKTTRRFPRATRRFTRCLTAGQPTPISSSGNST
jgi:hypothetical protein